MGIITLTMGTGAGATTIFIHNLGRYNGISCDKLMDVYKHAYISVGFKLDRMETMPGFYEMIFSFPNPTDPQKPAGGGSFQFFLPKTKEVSCSAYMPTMGVLGHYDAYNLEQHNAFEKVILAADQKAQALVTKKVGPPEPERE